jgi:molecular chaperone GrpE
MTREKSKQDNVEQEDMENMECCCDDTRSCDGGVDDEGCCCAADESPSAGDKKHTEIQTLQKELDALKDLSQRRQADFENYKKRNQKQQEEFRKFAIRDFALDIIMINDDLLRAIEASSSVQENESMKDAHDSFLKGVSLISKRIVETLENYGVVEIEAENKEFDPSVHEAVEINTSDEVVEDMVTKVYQRGFRIDEIVVRSARVCVTKPGKKRDGPAEAAAE